MAKLKIIKCKFDSGEIVSVGDTFEAMINPESYSHSLGLKYGSIDGKNVPVNKCRAIPKYAAPEPQKLGFTIILDDTGVVPGTRQTIAQQVDQLRKVVYDYAGEEHEPTPVKIIWGSGLKEFYGRLTTMGIDYTLFDQDGKALRAKIKLDFIEAYTVDMEALKAKRRSPDLTRVVRVRMGDTLPLLCHQIYKDAGKYLDIARFNDLDSFSDLVPDTLLRFPPMR